MLKIEYINIGYTTIHFMFINHNIILHPVTGINFECLNIELQYENIFT